MDSNTQYTLIQSQRLVRTKCELAKCEMAATCSGMDEGISSISGETLEKARRELKEIPEKRADAIRELRSRIEELEQDPDKDEDGPVFERKDGKFLLMFLRARKFSIDRAVQLYTNYYKYRHKHASLLTDYHPSSVEHVFRTRLFGVVDKRLKNGSKAFCLYPARWDCEVAPPNDCYKAAFLILEKMMEDEETQVHGITILDNMEGMPFYVVTNFIRSEPMSKRAIVELQDTFPVRFKGIHFLNEPWYLNLVLRLVKPFLKQKHRDRFHAYGSDYTGLHEHMDPQHLPADFGGFLPPLCSTNLHKLFERELSHT